MSFYNDIKELYKDTHKIMEGNIFQVVRFLRIFSFVGICIIYLLDKCNLKKLFQFDLEICFPKNISNFLNEYTLKIIIFYFVFLIIIKPFLKAITVHIEVKYKIKIFPLWFTITDIVEITFNGLVLLKIIQDVLLCYNEALKIVQEDIYIYIFVIVSAICDFIYRIYLKNSNNWYYISIKYTEYFDSQGKRIAEDDKVVYKNKIYDLYSDKGVYYIHDYRKGTSIKLEEALADKDGNLRIFYFDMGKKKAKDNM